MWVDFDVYLERWKVPVLSDWAEAISRAGFRLAFPELVNLAKHTGYLPVVLGEEEPGLSFSCRAWIRWRT